MVRPRFSLALLLGLAGTATAVSCFVGGFDVAEPPATTTDTGTGGAAGAPGCSHASWPGAPASADPGTDVELVLAVRSVEFGEAAIAAGQGPDVGYDLDHYCTCQGEGSECVAPSWTTEEHCDGPAGRDNDFSVIFEAASAFQPSLSSASSSAQLEAGALGLLIRLSGYDGQPNDDVVTAALFPSGGLDDEPCAGSPTPAWDGADVWPVVHTAIAGTGGADAGVPTGGAGGCTGTGLPGLDPANPKYVDTEAYVTDGVLVASFPEAALLLSASPDLGTLRLTTAFVTGRLERTGTDGPWLLHEGLLVGRAALLDVQLAVGGVVAGGQPMCMDHPYYDYVKSVVCRFPDLMSSMGGPTTPCDAISFGMGFEAVEAQLGRVLLAPGSEAAPCAPELDPSTDSCGSGGSG